MDTTSKPSPSPRNATELFSLLRGQFLAEVDTLTRAADGCARDENGLPLARLLRRLARFQIARALHYDATEAPTSAAQTRANVKRGLEGIVKDAQEALALLDASTATQLATAGVATEPQNLPVFSLAVDAEDKRRD